MAEPTRSDPVNCLSNFVLTGSAVVSPKEDLPRPKNSLQEVRSGASRRTLQVGYGRSSGTLIPPDRPFVHMVHAPLDQPSLESEGTLSTGRPDRAELHDEARLAHRHDQDIEPRLAHYTGAIKTDRFAANGRGLAKVFEEKTKTPVALAPVPLGTLVDPHPLYCSATEFPSELPCAHL
jgi:hypothetical protein